MNVQTATPAIDFTPSRAARTSPGAPGTGNTDNTVPIEAWNTVLFEKFCRFRHVMSKGLSGHSDELFRRMPYPAGARVLDIGCGFGDTTQLIAAQVTPSGEAIGVDCAQNFIDLATREADEEFDKERFVFCRRRAMRRPWRPLRPRVLALRHHVLQSARASRCVTSGARLYLAAS